MSDIDTADDLMKKLLEGAPPLLPEDEPDDKPEPTKKWRNKWRWRHPKLPLPRPDGTQVPPGGEFLTSSIWPTAKAAKERADQQLYGFSGKCWPIQLRPFLEYRGPVAEE